MQDRLLHAGPFLHFEYTADGRLNHVTYGAAEIPIEYDEFGNLRKVTFPGDDPIEYLVDGLGRRVGIRYQGQLQQQLIYRDGLNPIAMIKNGVVSEFFFGTRQNVPDLMRRNGQIYRIVSDYLGSPRLVVNIDNPADVLLKANYNAWGTATFVTGDGNVIPFGFAGGLYDPNTGFVRFGARDYFPGMGRWTNKDPILFAGAQGNLYAYTFNDPINFTDVDGLIGIQVGFGGIVAVGFGVSYSVGGYFDVNVHTGQITVGAFGTGSVLTGLGFGVGGGPEAGLVWSDNAFAGPSVGSTILSPEEADRSTSVAPLLVAPSSACSPV